MIRTWMYWFFDLLGTLKWRPGLKEVAAPAVTDQDGMPDAWETEKGLNTNNSSDASGKDLSTYYINLEVYLNSLGSNNINFGN
jgi:hypothetical protein